MRAQYDNPQLEAILDEQVMQMPRGPLGILLPPEVKLDGPTKEG